MSEFPVEVPFEEELRKVFFGEEKEEEDDDEQLLINMRKEEETARNELLTDPRLDPLIAQRIREGKVKRTPTNEEIKRKYRQSLESIVKQVEYYLYGLQPDIKDAIINNKDAAHYIKILSQTPSICEKWWCHLKSVEDILVFHIHGLAQQAKALENDPDKQTEFQALWSKAHDTLRGWRFLHSYAMDAEPNPVIMQTIAHITELAELPSDKPPPE